VQHVPDPYRLLGVSRGASEAQIKAAHRSLAKRYHPDAPSGDTVRFLQVQEAYHLLSDPLRRREWDARHSPGPVRAGQPAAARPRAANGRWTRAGDASGQRSGGGSPPGPAARGREAASPGRDASARSYTWSASEVPWWEEHGPRESRRQPGRQRPREAERPGPTDVPHDFDVYNRSSGAAWSSAARAYFRRGDSELPRRGSFQRQGTQPLTAARARAAAEEQARRNAGAAGRARPSGAEAAADETGREPADQRPRPSSRSSAPPAGRPAPEGRAETAERRRPQEWAGGTERASRPPTGAGQPAYAWAGVARDAQSIAQARSTARDASRAAAWPNLTERLAFAFLAWLPVAILIGYAGSVVTGCDRAAVSCPPQLEAVQSVLIVAALAMFVALPRLAYIAALGAAGLIVGAMALVLGAWFAGVRPPLPLPVLAVVGVVLAIVYLATASWALADGPRRRPWVAYSRRRFGQGR
jgi:curved DNA-binding protein CbpA